MTSPASSFITVLRRAVSRVDGWANLLTGVGAQAGATQHRTRYGFQGANLQSLPALEQLYHEDPDVRTIATALPEDALRPGFSVKLPEEAGGADAATVINSALADLHVEERMAEAWTWARVHGGGALVLGCEDGRDPEGPLDMEALVAVRWVVSVTASELIPHTWENNPRSPRFGEPEVYRLQRTSAGGGADNSLVHRTRVIRFEGITTTRQQRARLNGWGQSLVQNCYDRLEEWNGAHAAVTELLQQASVGVLKMRDLMALLGSDPDGLLRARLEAMDLARSVARSVLLDADGESYERTEVGALSGLPDILDRYSLRLTAAIGMPITRFLGRSPAGLNSTGEGDEGTWDDKVNAARRKVLLPAATQVAKLLLLSSEGPTRGVEPEGWSIVLPPLREPTSTEQAGLRKTIADTDAVYIQNGVLTPEEVAKSRFRPEGWSAETTVDLAAREEPGVTGDPAQADAVAGIVAKVAARELPRDTGVAMLVELLGADAATAERLMGETGRTFFTAREPTEVEEGEPLEAGDVVAVPVEGENSKETKA